MDSLSTVEYQMRNVQQYSHENTKHYQKQALRETMNTRHTCRTLQTEIVGGRLVEHRKTVITFFTYNNRKTHNMCFALYWIYFSLCSYRHRYIGENIYRRKTQSQIKLLLLLPALQYLGILLLLKFFELSQKSSYGTPAIRTFLRQFEGSVINKQSTSILQFIY